MTLHPSKDQLVVDHRTQDHPIEPLFLNRWSPRAFDGSEMPETDLKTILEAARWAPSAFNIQPWRFVYALRGDANWQTLVNLLNPFNRDWAQNASALVYLLSDTLVENSDGSTRASGTHAFDAGAAWSYAALQATALGYYSHGMAGILKDDIHQALNVPARFQPEIAIAIGRRGDVTTLPEGLQGREAPSPRKPLDEIAFSGSFKG
ncbi:nitroreductase family protein [Roseibium limicola]|uniref:Nitroreductase family protein n=1 Tax=Roseibium limicola TaxID=2816037 RepID=A0A939EQP8_9HYPH|nr:nitroreductase family protein [Roseibium limicola]MBO0345334.1 nitroreductase family protein [Roseibium limicola]